MYVYFFSNKAQPKNIYVYICQINLENIKVCTLYWTTIFDIGGAAEKLHRKNKSQNIGGFGRFSVI